MTTTKPQSTETLDRIWCANCENQIYQSGGKWFHLSTSGTSCGVTAKAMPSAPASTAPVVGNEHIAWCRYTYDKSGVIETIVTCDSDAKGAFKVYAATAATAATAVEQSKRAKCANCAETIIRTDRGWYHEYDYRPECLNAVPDQGAR